MIMLIFESQYVTYGSVPMAVERAFNVINGADSVSTSNLHAQNNVSHSYF